MRSNIKRFVAALVGVATLFTPVSAFAGEWCTTYKQVESDATGGQYVGGLLMYETMGTVTRAENTTTTTISNSTNTNLGIPGGGPSTGTTTTIAVATTEPGTVNVTQEPFGYYQMNDGSVYQINCLTGDALLVKAAS